MKNTLVHIDPFHTRPYEHSHSQSVSNSAKEREKVSGGRQ